MFPVWFLSYRNKDRVAYATVNGQTGKVVADLPVDLRKYFAGSILLAIPLFVLLNLFLTLTPGNLLLFIICLAAFTLILYYAEMKAIRFREENADDKGLLIYQQKQRKKENAINPDEPIDMTKGAKEKKALSKKLLNGAWGAIISIVLCVLVKVGNPVEDFYYYIGATVSLVGVFLTLTYLIRYYNILTTRKLPQFEHKGGDDRA